MKISYLTRKDKPKLAYIYSPASGSGVKYPLVMFCGGYRSDMDGTKARYLEAQCQARGQAYVRFDYGGHGASEGAFEDGTIGSWLQDALDVLDCIEGLPVVVVGSSMGGWIALLIAKHRSGRVRGLLGLAPAPDFSEEMFARLDEAQQQTLLNDGVLKIPNDYSDEPYHYTKAFYQEAKAHLLLGEKHENDFPIRLVHGMKDVDVPWEICAQIQSVYEGAPVDIVYIDDGDHRLSRPEDLEVIDQELCNLCDI